MTRRQTLDLLRALYKQKVALSYYILLELLHLLTSMLLGVALVVLITISRILRDDHAKVLPLQARRIVEEEAFRG